MRYVETRQWVASGEKSEWQVPAAVFLAVALFGLALANRAPTASVTAPELPEAASPAPARVATLGPAVALRPSVARPVAPLAPPAAEPLPQGAELDPAIPVAAAVQSRGLLAALLALEAEGDTTETSEGLELIASPDAVEHALLDAGPETLRAAAPEPLARQDSVRLLVASGE
jgi:hypothetical protein